MLAVESRIQHFMEGRAIRASHASQLRLLELQAIDSKIQQVKHRRATLPELTEAATLKKQVNALDDQLIAAGTRVADLELELSKAESDLVPVRQRRERNQQRIDSGEVSDGTTLSNLIAEVAHLDRRISELEDGELELMERVESAQQQQAELTQQRAEAHAALAAVVQRGRATMAEIDTELTALASQREAMAKELPQDLFDRYQRLAVKHDGVGAAALEQRRCTGCQLVLNSAEIGRFASAHVDEVLTCEQCGRIVVRTERSGL